MPTRSERFAAWIRSWTTWLKLSPSRHENLSWSKVEKIVRTGVKINAYKLSIKKSKRQHNISKKQARKMVDAYFKTDPHVNESLEKDYRELMDFIQNGGGVKREVAGNLISTAIASSMFFIAGLMNSCSNHQDGLNNTAEKPQPERTAQKAEEIRKAPNSVDIR